MTAEQHARESIRIARTTRALLVWWVSLIDWLMGTWRATCIQGVSSIYGPLIVLMFKRKTHQQMIVLVWFCLVRFPVDYICLFVFLLGCRLISISNADARECLRNVKRAKGVSPLPPINCHQGELLKKFAAAYRLYQDMDNIEALSKNHL